MKAVKKIYLLLTAVSLHSCHTTMPIDKTSNNFDIPSFIHAEVEKLQALNPTITKTVSNGKSTEVKQLKISNWKNELSHFANIDINKNRGFDFSMKMSGDTIVYKSTAASDHKILIKVIYSQNSPNELYIIKKSQNLLYVNDETLHYSVGKAYSIDKKQHVRGIGNNHYQIKVEIN